MNKKITTSTIIMLLIGAGFLYTLLNKKTTEVPEQTAVTQNNENNINKFYSLSEVAQHKTENDCWTSINGKVYSITELIPNHPAGKEKIMKGCGIDATTIFSRVPKHDLDLLKQNIIGDLK